MAHFLNAEEKRPFCGTSARGIVLFVSLILAAGTAALQAAPILSAISGNAFVMKAGTSIWQPASARQPLAPLDQVRTTVGSRATITFEDGSRIELGPNGSFALQQSSPNSGSIKLMIGNLRAWVSKGLSKRFEVRTP